jgi:dipeptidase E
LNPRNPGSPLSDSSRHIVAFGGDGFLAEPENKLSAHFLLGLTGKPKPRISFLPTASGDAGDYIGAFYLRYSRDLCDASHLALFHRAEKGAVKDVRSFLLSQDVIYVGGGNTANMLAVWRVHGVDKILREAYEAGIVLCGTSAGSLCWFECGVTDSFGLDLAPFYDGLGFTTGSNCPHYDSEEMRQPQYHKFIMEGLPGGYAADDGAALHFVNGEFREAVSSKENARAFHVQKREDKIVETPMVVRFLGT